MKYDLHNHTLDIAVQTLAKLYQIEPDELVIWAVRKLMNDFTELMTSIPDTKD